MNNEDRDKLDFEKQMDAVADGLGSGEYLVNEYLEEITEYRNNDTDETVTITTKTPKSNRYGEKITKQQKLPQDVVEYAQSLVQDADELLLKKLEKMPHYVQDFLTKGLTVYAAPSKLGKSFACIHLAECLAKGENFLNLEVTQPYKVLYLALEDMENGLSDRLHLLEKSGFNDNFKYALHNPLFKDVKYKYGAIESLIQNNNFDVVIIDTLAKFNGEADVSNADAYNKDSPLIHKIQGISARNEMSIIVVTHTNQSKSKAGTHSSIQGSTGIIGSADNIWLANENGISVGGRFLKDKEFPIVWNSEKAVMEWSEIKASVKPIKTSVVILRKLDMEEKVKMMAEPFSIAFLVKVFEYAGYTKKMIDPVVRLWREEKKVELVGSGKNIKYQWISD